MKDNNSNNIEEAMSPREPLTEQQPAHFPAKTVCDKPPQSPSTVNASGTLKENGRLCSAARLVSDLLERLLSMHKSSPLAHIESDETYSVLCDYTRRTVLDVLSNGNRNLTDRFALCACELLLQQQPLFTSRLFSPFSKSTPLDIHPRSSSCESIEIHLSSVVLVVRLLLLLLNSDQSNPLLLHAKQHFGVIDSVTISSLTSVLEQLNSSSQSNPLRLLHVHFEEQLRLFSRADSDRQCLIIQTETDLCTVPSHQALHLVVSIGSIQLFRWHMNSTLYKQPPIVAKAVFSYHKQLQLMVTCEFDECSKRHITPASATHFDYYTSQFQLFHGDERACFVVQSIGANSMTLVATQHQRAQGALRLLCAGTEVPLIEADASTLVPRIQERSASLPMLSSLCNVFGFSLLHFAAFLGHSSLCQALVAQCGVRFDAPDALGCTALHWSLFNGHRDVTLFLLSCSSDQMASMHSQTLFGETAFTMARSSGHITLHDEVATLLHHGSLSSLAVSSTDTTSQQIHIADDLNAADRIVNLIKRNDLEGLYRALSSCPPVDQLQYSDEQTRDTALHLAVKHNLPYVVQQLLVYGAQASQMNVYGEFPLMIAVSMRSIDMSRMLLDIGHADVNQQSHQLWSRTALHVAVIDGNVHMVSFLLEYKADLSLRESSMEQTGLHIAVTRCLPEIAQLLVVRGASITATDKLGRTPMDLCTYPDLKTAVARAFHQRRQQALMSGASPVTPGSQEIAFQLHQLSINTSNTPTSPVQVFSGAATIPPYQSPAATHSGDGLTISIESGGSAASSRWTARRLGSTASDESPQNSNTSPQPLAQQLLLQQPQKKRGRKKVTSLSPDSTMNTEEFSNAAATTATLAVAGLQQPLAAVSEFAPVDTDEEARRAEQQWPVQILLKPSRRKGEFIDFFPRELCSAPYKYDLVITIPNTFNSGNAENITGGHFRLRILVPVREDQWFEVLSGVQQVKCLRISGICSTGIQIEWRISFTVCSFHFQRKPFKLQVVYSETPFNEGSSGMASDGGEQDDDDDDADATSPTSPITPVGKNGQQLFPQHVSHELPEGQSVVYESRQFSIVARKKKDSYLWATRKQQKQNKAGTDSGNASSNVSRPTEQELPSEYAEMSGGDSDGETPSAKRTKT